MRNLTAEHAAIPGFRCIRCGRYPLAAMLVILVNALPQFASRSAYGEFEDSDAGYVDSAFIGDRIRLRVDGGFNMNRPDRAEYFYGSWVNLLDHPHAIKGTDQIVSSVNNRGPIFLAKKIDFQEITTYLEVAYQDRASVFVELPFRLVQFLGDGEDPNAFSTPEFRAAYDHAPTETEGVSDLRVGFKCGILHDPNALITFQFRTFIPTGKSVEGLGTGHVSLEPALLAQLRLTQNLSYMGQAKIWTPIDGGVNAGNIAIYGGGLGYELNRSCSHSLRFVPMVEFLGWTVLDGFETLSSPESLPVVPNSAMVPFNPNNIREDGQTVAQVLTANGQPVPATGTPVRAPKSHGVKVSTSQTIINAKLGVRTHFNLQDSIYVGWGRSLTGARWYKDFARVEFRRLF